MGLRLDMIQGLKRSKTGDAAPFCGHIEWSMRFLELRPESKEVSCRNDSNASKNALFGCHMREILPLESRVVC